ncbi:MAG: hypothetical protein ACJAUP_001816 [Cellvibrionaceae bacterium]|jgi:hypothetical protein
MLVETVLPRSNKYDSRTLVANNYDQLRYDWRHNADKAHSLHKNGKIKHATVLFTQCISIATKLLHTQSQNNPEQSGIELLYFASHNLAACQNLLRQGTNAEHTLRHVYQTIIELCEAPNIAYETKLEALAVLDKSLFSLTSQLAYLGKVEQIHTLIKMTDTLAERTLKLLQKK